MVRHLGQCVRYVFITLLLLPSAVQAGSFELAGHVELETRLFPNDPAFPEQEDRVISPSIALQPEFRFEWNDGRDRLTATPFFRYDLDDDERTHGDLRAFNWSHRADNWDVLAGVGRVFWGVAESRHLVDVVNQVDLVENLDEEDRLGQPMVNVNVFTDMGSLGLFVLPRFRERTFADNEGRLRGQREILVDDPRYDSGAEQYHVDFAARWWHTIGGLDVGISHFHGTGREPRLLAEMRNGKPVFIPFYDQIDQTSIDAQITTGDWLIKFEGLTRTGQGDRFFASVAGFEYTFNGVGGSRADLGLLAEYHYDGRDDPALLSIFDRDIFVGVRLGLNDSQSTEILASAIIDQSNQSTLLNLEVERRIGESWKIEMEARFFVNVDESEAVLGGIQRDDHVLLRLSRFF
jgi:hypothetical protein